MILTILAAATHYVALGIGLTGVWIRGRGFRAGDVATTFYGDNLWGIAALLWIGSGLARAFGGLEKGTAFYLHSPMFQLKMALYFVAAALEMWPMIVLIKLRVRQSKGEALDLSRFPTFAKINTAEIALVMLMPFVASAMARGWRP